MQLAGHPSLPGRQPRVSGRPTQSASVRQMLGVVVVVVVMLVVVVGVVVKNVVVGEGVVVDVALPHVASGLPKHG